MIPCAYEAPPFIVGGFPIRLTSAGPRIPPLLRLRRGAHGFFPTGERLARLSHEEERSWLTVLEVQALSAVMKWSRRARERELESAIVDFTQ